MYGQPCKHSSKSYKQASHAKTELIEWEKLYFIENNFKSPTVLDIKQSVKASEIYSTMRYAKSLLKEWKVPFD